MGWIGAAALAMVCQVWAVGAAALDMPASQGPGEAGMVITNARIIDGTGRVIESGAVLVREGRIAAVTGNAAAAPGALVVDAAGMTVMPGFIDGHRHMIRGDPQQWLSEQAPASMQEFLDAGFTTVMSCGDPLTEILELRRRLAGAEIAGPRLLTVGWLPLARSAGPRPEGDPARAHASWAPRVTAEAIPAAETRAVIQQYKEAGVDAIKTVMMVTPQGPEKATLKLAVEEGRRLGLPVITHAVTVMDTLASVEAGVTTLVHTPVDGDMSEEQTRFIAQAGIPMISTLGVFVPFFGNNNEALFRDGTPFPWERLYHAGDGAVNARLLWNAGITYGFGTDTPYGGDTGWLPRDTLAHEIRSLSLVFSPRDIVTIMTGNSAAAVGLGSEIGTLEPGKRADIVLLEGDPMENSDALLNVRMVIKGGQVMVDNR